MFTRSNILVGGGQAPTQTTPSLKFQERSYDNSQIMTDENKNMFLGEVQITGARNAQSPSALNMNSDYRQIRQTVGASDAISHRVEKKNG